ncbi:MAG: sigma-70 family RNA polymerase sigma factor [Acetobacteraceae bacterium]|nr:sigma-70 family RNA polymerase sigma factor [Acetobacteraceae bacterium]
MSAAALDRAARQAGGRIIAALAARFRSLDVAEEAFAEACARAAEAWPRDGAAPRDPAAWLYRVALRCALDALRRRRTRERLRPDPPEPERSVEDRMADDTGLIPDERLRLIFVCCHPAVAADARAALTLRLVCGLSTAEIARAFLVSESALAQRLVRAKRKIAEAGVPFEVPGPEAWPERLDAVLSTLEVAYAKAYEDAAGAGPHAGYATEALALTRVLVELLPEEPEALALAALVRYAEARRPARLDGGGAMVPLSEQDPALWRRPLIEEADAYLSRAAAARRAPPTPRMLQAAIHRAWCARRGLADPPPWREVLTLYDALLACRDDSVVRLNRAVALAEVAGPGAALEAVEAMSGCALRDFLPYQAVRADLLRRVGLIGEARAAYDAALALGPAPAERLWLRRRADRVAP